MPGASKMTTPVAVDLPQIEARYAELGGYTVGIEAFPQDADLAPFFAGLPGDCCPCPHRVIVHTGETTFRWADYEETYGAGDAYSVAPDHLPRLAAGTGVLEFSPTDTLGQTMAAVERILVAAVGGAS